jgi:hypothetical protein
MDAQWLWCADEYVVWWWRSKMINGRFMGHVMPYWLVSSFVSVCELCSSYFFVVPGGIFYLCNMFFAPLLCPVVLLLL